MVAIIITILWSECIMSRHKLFTKLGSNTKPIQTRKDFHSTVLGHIDKTHKGKSLLGDFQKVYKGNTRASMSTLPQLVDSIENHKKNLKLVYRGMKIEEVSDLLKKQKFLCPPKPKKERHYNIPEHVIQNNSSAFGSFTLSLTYGGDYASKSTIVPSSGAIVEANYPPFFVNPKELLATHEEMFKRFSDRYEGDQRIVGGRFMGLTNIFETTANNSEITMIRNMGNFYCGLHMHDVRAIHILTVPGKILSKWTSIDTPLHDVTFINPDYKQRVCAIKVGFAENDNFLDEEYEIVNQRNRDMKLIPEDARIITIHEAKYIAKSGLLESLNDMYEIDETLVLSHVSSNIPVNDIKALVEYIRKTVESLPNLKKKESRIEELTELEPEGDGPTKN